MVNSSRGSINEGSIGRLFYYGLLQLMFTMPYFKIELLEKNSCHIVRLLPPSRLKKLAAHHFTYSSKNGPINLLYQL